MTHLTRTLRRALRPYRLTTPDAVILSLVILVGVYTEWFYTVVVFPLLAWLDVAAWSQVLSAWVK